MKAFQRYLKHLSITKEYSKEYATEGTRGTTGQQLRALSPFAEVSGLVSSIPMTIHIHP